MFLKDISKKNMILKKLSRRQKSMKNYPVGKEFKEICCESCYTLSKCTCYLFYSKCSKFWMPIFCVYSSKVVYIVWSHRLTNACQFGSALFVKTSFSSKTCSNIFTVPIVNDFTSFLYQKAINSTVLEKAKNHLRVKLWLTGMRIFF